MASKDPINKVHLKNGKTRYRFVIDVGTRPDGGRDQRTHTYDTLKEARTERANIISEMAKGTFVAPAKTTVEAYLSAWLHGKRNLRPGTRDRYRDALKPVIERLGKKPLQQLGKSDLDKLTDWMLTGGRRINAKTHAALSARSVSITLIVLTSALGSAVKQGILARNVASLVERPTHRKPEMQTWTAEQAAAFLTHVADDRLYVAWLLAMYGLRRSEVIGLRWKDVDLVNKTLTVNWARTASANKITEGEPKTERGNRTLPLDDALVAAFERLSARQMKEMSKAGAAYQACELCDEAHVIVNEVGEPRRPYWMSERFGTHAKRAGLPVIRLHDARHTCGTLMHLRGVPTAVISAWLGHSSAAFTLRTYVHSQNDALVAAGAALTGAITPTSIAA